jgi:DNA-binding IclR family transcriptional regulator
MSDDNKNLGSAQLRLLKVIEALSGNEVFGIRLKEVAAAVKTGDPTVLRDLNTLASAGWAKQDESGRWRLDTKPVQISVNFAWGLNKAQERLTEIQQRYTRTPA